MHYLYSVDHRKVGTLTLNRPEVRNAFNEESIAELTDFFKTTVEEDHLRLVVLKGAGKSFCAGADLIWMKKMIHYSKEENIRDSMDLANLFEAIDTCPVPVIGKVHGAALGGGVGLVSVCDCVLSSEETIFAFSEVRLGLIPAVISPYVMAKIGSSLSRAFFLSGERFSASRAYEWGLVHEVCLLEELDSRTETKVQEFLKAGPHASQKAKELIGRVASQNKELKDMTCQMIADIRLSQEAQEGMGAFLEKKKPSWLKE